MHVLNEVHIMYCIITKKIHPNPNNVSFDFEPEKEDNYYFNIGILYITLN